MNADELVSFDIKIADILRAARKNAGLLQTQLADRSGVGWRTISCFEVMQVTHRDAEGNRTGYRTPSFAQGLRLLAACYYTTPEELLELLARQAPVHPQSEAE